MACFIAPLVEAIAVTVIRKVNHQPKTILGRQLPALEKMLWGGTLMLVVDHIINGELTWKFPFFTALNELEGAQVMLREILVVGVPMALALTLAWGIYALIKEKKATVSINQ
ncbi:MAG: hypothetical protein J5748_00345 [Bacteroidales bacterium]|nr:hypothetical protein [Bacteroidales bacterium]